MLDFDPNSAHDKAAGVFGLPHKEKDSALILVPVPWEATTSYGGGTANGPGAVFEASKQVDLFDRDTGRPYEAGIAMLDIPKKIERCNRKAKELAAAVIEKGGPVDGATRRIGGARGGYGHARSVRELVRIVLAIEERVLL